jgi:arylsulfatase A-like enzyme
MLANHSNSKLPAIGFIASRVVFAALILMASVYCVLCYIPFTYIWIVHRPIFPAVTFITANYWWMFLVGTGAVVYTLRGALRHPRTKRIALAFVTVHGAAAVLLPFASPASELPNDERSLAYGLVIAFSVVWLSAMDLMVASRGPALPFQKGTGRMPVSGFAIVALVIALIACIGADRSTLLVALVRSLLAYGAVFAIILAVLSFTWLLASRISAGNPWRVVVAHAGPCALFGFAFAKFVLAPATILGVPAFELSVAYAVAVLAVSCVVRVQWAAISENDAEAVSWKRPAAACAGVIAAVVLMRYRPALDWNGTLQSTAIIAGWVLMLVAVTKCFPRTKRPSAARIGAVCALSALLIVANLGLGAVLDHKFRDQVDGATREDVLLKVALDATTFSQRYDADPTLVAELRADSNLHRALSPVPIRLNDDGSSQADRPNIFVIVVDSLRPDYLSPYNAHVRFTPALGDFARDSIVFTNAFTRYGGTYLAEPSIWSGTLLPHGEYPAAFGEMNTLFGAMQQRGYRSYLGWDDIVSAIVPASNSITRLNSDTTIEDFAFEQLLKNYRSSIAAMHGTVGPAFMYIQPQDVHELSSSERVVQAWETQEYTGFNANYAQRVRRVDATFAEFVALLKQRGQYDNSIIVVTSDHGEALGDYGRSGHTNGLSPEVIRVPLMVHLPAKMRTQLHWDATRVAFNTDITPSLCYLLGFERNTDPLFGTPLFTRTEAELEQARGGRRYMIVSSYMPVYATISENGRSLFLLDARTGKSGYYDLATDPHALHNINNDDVEAENETFLKDSVRLLMQRYGAAHAPAVAMK